MDFKNLSVFMPAFNEEKNIEKTVVNTLKVLQDLNLQNFEVIVVDDGSSDRTAQIVEKISKIEKRVRLIKHAENKGYGGALKSGFENAKYEWVAFIDSDGQFDFSEIIKFIEKASEADLILGYRVHRADPFIRDVFTFGWKTITKVLLGLKVKDYSCGFKLIKREVYEACLPLEAGEKVTQIELLVKAKRNRFKLTEVGVSHYPRKFGNQTGANIKVVLKSLVDLFKLWWQLKEDKLFFLILVGVLTLAALLRFYRLPEYMTFLGDEGRDALMIKRILTTGDIPLLGAPTSIGNIYLGPLYYYMMTIPMAIFWLNPLAAAAQVAILGVATVWLIYYLTKEWFGVREGLSAAFLYAISPVNIIYSRSSWNPNPAPFFSLLAILGLYKAHRSGDFKWFILTGISLAFVVQMHYLALILVPILGLLWAYELSLKLRGKLQRHFWLGTFGAIIALLILMSPLVIFDLKHNYMNFNAIKTFFSNRETTINLNPLNTLYRTIPIYQHNLVGRYMTPGNDIFSYILSILIILPLFVAFISKMLGRPIRWSFLALGVWLLIGVFGLSLYKQNIYDHYIGFLNPVPYILLGGCIGLVKNRLVRYLFIGLLIILVYLNLSQSPLKQPPNNQLQRTKDVAKFIINRAEGKPLNFALIAKNNYDSAYQFYLDVYGHKPKVVPTEMTDQLFVVCEDPVCEPIGSPKYEIAAFGWAKVEDVQDFSGVKVFKLIHNPSGEPPK